VEAEAKSRRKQMTVKKLIEKLEAAVNPDAEVVINTKDGELQIIDTIGQYEDVFTIDTVLDM
jgi:hypothetical protein